MLKTDEMHDKKPVYLICMLEENTGDYVQYRTTNADIKPEDNFFDQDGYIRDSLDTPMVAEKTYNHIPFTIVNVKQLGTAFEKPWLESVSDASIDLFQASADHKNYLYHAGDSILCGTGVKIEEMKNVTAGSGGKATSESPDAKFYYAVAGADGAAPKLANVESNEKNTIALGVDLVNQGVESGVALETRTNIKTASLTTLAKTGAEGLQFSLRMQAEWMGLNPDDVTIVANTEFGDKMYTATELRDLFMSGEILRKDIYTIQKKQGLTSSDSYEEWLKEWEDEAPVEPTVV